MRRTKKLCLLLVVLAIIALSGIVQAADPIVLTDHMGRTVKLDGPAQRVIGTHNPSMNMVVVVDGNGYRIAGFGNKDMAYSLYEMIAPELNRAPQVGMGRNYNMETVFSVNPDLVILPQRMANLIGQFEAADIPVLVLNVEKYDTIMDALMLVGKAVGQEARAQKITAFMKEKISEFSSIASKAKHKPRVLFIGSSSQYNVSVDAMLQNETIKFAGGQSVTAGFPGDFWTEVDIEQIIKWNPEVIYMPRYASYTREDIMNSPVWNNIDAVKNGRVYVFPSQLEPWDYPVAAAILGLIWTCHNLHPDLYTYEQMLADVDEYYDLVYGRKFTAHELGIAE